MTDLKPPTPPRTPEATSESTPSHRQLELDLETASDSTIASTSETTPEDRPTIHEGATGESESTSIATNPAAARRWAMTWKPDADATNRNSQHPAARVARENVDAAINQPAIPAVGSPDPERAPADRTETLVTDDESRAESGETTAARAETTTPEPGFASTPAADATLGSETPSAKVVAAEPEPIADETSTPVIEPTPATTEPAESDEPDESDVAPEIAAVPLVTTPAQPTIDHAPADQSMPAPAGSGAIRVTAAGWIVAVLIGLGWLIASNRPTNPPTPATAVLPAVTPGPAPGDEQVDAEAITALEAALADLEATSATAAERISTLETELEGVRSDAAYLNRERSLLQAELEGLMEIIEPPAATTNTPAPDG